MPKHVVLIETHLDLKKLAVIVAAGLREINVRIGPEYPNAALFAEALASLVAESAANMHKSLQVEIVTTDKERIVFFAGVGAATGAAIGFSFGGLPGALVGTGVGLVVGAGMAHVKIRIVPVAPSGASTAGNVLGING
jgi:hypothetical protein